MRTLDTSRTYRGLVYLDDLVADPFPAGKLGFVQDLCAAVAQIPSPGNMWYTD